MFSKQGNVQFKSTSVTSKLHEKRIENYKCKKKKKYDKISTM